MKRREFIALLGSTFATWPLPTSAQPKGTAVVGFLGAVRDDKVTSGFEMRLRDLGWMMGQNLSIEYRWADGDLARLPFSNFTHRENPSGEMWKRRTM